jgi:iron complex outermembrane receptor protein
MKYTQALTALLFAAPGLHSYAEQPLAQDIKTEQTTQLETVKVSADFRQLDLQQLPSAITVISADAIQNRNADHLESILSLAPNVNFAASSSRARYFQIRGIGERSQFIDPVNPSVALIIDGIDMTGLGGAATLFDIDQVEVLRGPQGTAFGANALAGAINIKSKQPTKETEGYIEAKAGNYNSQGLGGAISGSLTDSVQGRFAINTFNSDGYMNNVHLNKKDTNNIDETVSRAQLAWQVNANNDVNFSILKTDIDNGYDAFSLDNNRNTYSNEPGKDTQDTTALSVLWHSKINTAFDLQVNASTNKTKSEYSYDDDWSFGEYDEDTGVCLDDCIENPDGTTGLYGYTGFDQYLRDYKRNAIDLRLVSGLEGRLLNNTTEWIMGIYDSSKELALIKNYDGNFDYSSKIKTVSTAIYTELSTQLSLANRLIYGIRIEETSFEFQDSRNLAKSQSETLWGGKVTFESMLTLNHLTYASFARGFKAGSVNSEPTLTEEYKKLYDTEINYTLESGIKSSLLNDELQTRIAVFYTQRADQQVKLSNQIEGTQKFKDYFANAAKGLNYGIELEGTYDISNDTTWDFSIGLLQAEFINYQFETEENGAVKTIIKDGDEQAHAPTYSASTAITQNLTDSLNLRIETELKDSFYYSNSHLEKSSSYQIWNASINYTFNNLELSLHGKNLTNVDYTTKGFYFGIDPRIDYQDKTYTQLGNPRLVSLNAAYQF